MMTTESTPGALGSHDQLGPLPPHRKVTAHGRMWTEEDMRAYRAAGVAVERERWSEACNAYAVRLRATPTAKLPTPVEVANDLRDLASGHNV